MLVILTLIPEDEEDMIFKMREEICREIHGIKTQYKSSDFVKVAEKVLRHEANRRRFKSFLEFLKV